MDSHAFQTPARVVKFDEELGLAIGWAIVCEEKNDAGEYVKYVDTQQDWIPPDSMLKAATEFMLDSRAAKQEHSGDVIGDIVFAMPLTQEIARAFEIETDRTGLMIAMKPSEEVLGKFKSGELTAFSIGGRYLENEIVDAEALNGA